MSRNVLNLVIALLVTGTIVGYLYYRGSRTGMDIEIGEHGITIEGN